MLDHLAGRSSNLLLQRAFDKYGKENFQFVVYAYVPYILPHITDIETLFMSYFPQLQQDQLYNLTSTATSMYGYKHTENSIAKMKARLIDPKNHPMFGKSHSSSARKLISKPGILNPMFGKKHSFPLWKKHYN